MKTLFTFLAVTILTVFAQATDVKLKITYNGNGVAGHTVTVMLGDAAIGSGVTDDGGNVTVSVSSLPVKDINLKGEKNCDNAKKSWEAKGYVKLDDNNYAELKMEELVKEMVEASGGFMSEKMLVGSYGLVCGGSSSSSNNSSEKATSTDNSPNTTDNSSNTNNNTSDNGAAGLMTREESLANQKTALESKLENINRKIEKKNEKIPELEGEKKRDAEFDVRELEIDKKQTQNKLDKVNLQMTKTMLNKEERNRFKDREDELDEEMKALKAERKNKGEVVKNDNTIVTDTSAVSNDEDDLVYTEAEFAKMSKNDLGKKKLSLNTELNKLKLKLKTRKNSMSPAEVTEAEFRIAKIEAAIVSIEAEQEKRKAEKE